MDKYTPISSSVNVRSLPHPNAKWLMALQAGGEVEIVEQRFNWGRFEPVGVVPGGWVDLDQMRRCEEDIPLTDAVAVCRRVSEGLVR